MDARKVDKMEEETILVENGSEVEIGDSVNEKDEEKKKQSKDLEFLSCMMQPATSDSDPQYVGIRRILLHRKAESGVLSRRYVSSLSLFRPREIAFNSMFLRALIVFVFGLKDWRCNGKGYVAYRNFISRPRKWENMRTPSLLSSPGNRFCSLHKLFFSYTVNLCFWLLLRIYVTIQF